MQPAPGRFKQQSRDGNKAKGGVDLSLNVNHTDHLLNVAKIPRTVDKSKSPPEQARRWDCRWAAVP